ncbi:MAG: DUF357 domain-containing protein [Candidatus Burarchaeum sp.]|nr:DUF357 domain-containing protein [Candidatus Burarchaeum sp.]MDO8339280.1 DUF357 domain-containing protein [Candidatus Burarchaeum sp.]
MAEKKESDTARIESDIRQLRDFVASGEGQKQKKAHPELFDMAERYCTDTEYHLKKGDLITAFGCINYAHGLLDSLKYEKSD